MSVYDRQRRRLQGWGRFADCRISGSHIRVWGISLHPLREHEVELVRAMVDASAAVVAPEDREDLFDEFAEDMRESGLVPGAESLDGDASDAGLVDGHVFLGVGLTVLGQIGYRVLMVATDMAIQRGLRDALAFARGLFARRSGAAPADADDTADAADPAAAAEEVAAQVVAAERDALPPQLDEAAIVEIVREQLRALAQAEARESGESAPA